MPGIRCIELRVLRESDRGRCRHFVSAFLEPCLLLWRPLWFPPPRRVPGEWAAPFRRALRLTCPPSLSFSPPSSTASFLFAGATSFFSLLLLRARKLST